MKTFNKDYFPELDADSLYVLIGENKCRPPILKRTWIFILGLVFWVSLSAAWAETIVVTASNGSIDDKDGSCSISEAIKNANADAQIHPDCTTGKGTDTILLSGNVTLGTYIDKSDGSNGTPSISSSIVLDGEGFILQRADSICNLDGVNQINEFRLLHIASTGNLTINNMSLKNGCADGAGPDSSGGGVFSRGTLVVSNSTVSGNHAEYRGGGLANSSDSKITEITNTTFSENSAFGGGAIYNSYSIATFEYNTFLSNSADYGGALYNHGSISIIKYSTFLGNQAFDSGGGIINNLGNINTIIGSIFSNNVAWEYGGGLYNYFATITTIENSTFSGNSAYRYGGGIYNYGTLHTLLNSTISDNTADDYGGGFCNYDGTVTTVQNSTFSGNSAEYGGGLYNRDVISKVINSTFSGNSASQEGGGIRNYNGAIGSLNNTIVTASVGGDCSRSLSENRGRSEGTPF